MQQRSVSIHITGTVQGVFFRHNTQMRADELGVKGFVRNEPDGSVFIAAEGEASHVKLFIEWCKRGPEAAVVEGVEVRDADFAGYSSFDVRR
ncbi:MAG TPA: acylphosphatase [Candidatus Peribacteria bacterium]|nr:acylphosphatase [Candidatus Peribacteria bacterium]